MTKSAMEQLVEQMKAELDGDLPREHRKAITPFYQVACRLLYEEQAQKPTAPAALWDEIFLYANLLAPNKTGSDVHNELRIILSRHRPVHSPAPSTPRVQDMPAPSSADEGLLEELSALEHRRWSSWQEYVHALSPLNDKGERVIPKESVEHWEKLIKTDYKDLTEYSKDMDRKEARKTLDILSRHPSTKSDRCAETVQEIRQRVTDYFNQSAWPTEFMKYAHMVSDKMHDILDEFSKDADGKEGR